MRPTKENCLRWLIMALGLTCALSAAAQRDRDQDRSRDATVQRDQQVDRDRTYDRERARDRDVDQDRVQDADRLRTQDRDSLHVRDRDRLRDEDIYGSELMTAEEREQYRQRLRSVQTDQEWARLRADHQEQMRARAGARRRPSAACLWAAPTDDAGERPL
jgi:hypothetical protein